MYPRMALWCLPPEYKQVVQPARTTARTPAPQKPASQPAQRTTQTTPALSQEALKVLLECFGNSPCEAAFRVKHRIEWDKAEAIARSLGVTKEEFIQSRRISDGLDPLSEAPHCKISLRFVGGGQRGS